MSALDVHESTRLLLNGWVENLAQVLESMTDHRPAINWKGASGIPADLSVATDGDVLWSEQKCQLSPDAEIWIGAPRQTWEHASTLTLKAAGLETSGPDETKSTWLEIIGQWTSALVRALGFHLGREVACGSSAENRPPDTPHEWITVSLTFGETVLPPIAIAFSAPLLAVLTAAPSAEDTPPAATPQHTADTREPEKTPAMARTMDLLLDVELPVSISFGKTQLALKDVLKLTTGSIVELNRGVNEPVEVLVNHCLVARGEVVVVEGNYGIRIQQISSRQDRLRSIR
ncbi:MAG TPA: flagellar motor switch protein FliN [Bryobacteraceae bacterium]|jgi:flagellar motor switch protein FliN/FliY|nr:flagellar motor switch protein FliN [Bryobacteraceae bacterium]